MGICGDVSGLEISVRIEGLRLRSFTMFYIGAVAGK